MKKLLLILLCLPILFSSCLNDSKNNISNDSISNAIISFSVTSKNPELTSSSGKDVSLNEMTTINVLSNDNISEAQLRNAGSTSTRNNIRMEGFTVYASVYGSWNPILPQGHEIVRIDFTSGQSNASTPSEQWNSTVTRFATDIGTPLPLVFGPEGNLYYATFGGGGTLYRITAN